MATYNKYKYYKRQYLSGGTWVDVDPLTLTLSGASYGTYDTLDDCVNSITPSMNFKFKLTSDTYPPYTFDCDSSTTLNGIEVYADKYDKGNYYSYSAGTGYVGNCVETIIASGGSLPDAREYVLSDTVTTIGDVDGIYQDYHRMFGLSLETINIPSGVTKIAKGVFYGCNKLNDIELPSGVTSIGEAAFSDCTSLEYCIIPSACTSIDWAAFSGCTSLINTTISNPSTVLGGNLFMGCTSLQTATVNATMIPGRIFMDCTNLRTVNLGQSITKICFEAFSGCSSLSAITIPNNVTSIEGGAFKGCSSLSSVTIPDSVTSISANCFYGCTELTGVTIGSGMTAIGNSAFTKNDKITTVYCYAETPPLMGSHVFSTYYNNEWHPISGMTIYVPCSSVQDYKTSSGWSGYSTCITAIPGTENNCTVKATLNTSQGIKYIYCDSSTYLTNRETSAYSNTLTSAVVGGGTGCVTIIDGAFAYMSNLKSVTINSGVTTINSSSFRQSYSLSSVTIPDTVTSIGGYAFYNCTGLTETLEIPSGVTTIYGNTFYGTNCDIKIKNKTSVIYLPDGISAFQGNTSTRYIYVPCSMLDSYKASGYWTGLTNYIVGYEDDGTPCDPSNYMKLHYYNQYNTGTVECSSSTTLTSGEVSQLQMFNYPSYIRFGNCVTAIGDNAFGSRQSSPYIYMDSNNPTKLEFPSNITSIGQEAFYKCSAFRSVTLNSSITSIGNRAFRDCSGLTSVTFNSTTPPVIGTSIFSGCTSLQAIYVPCESYNSYITVANLSEYSDKIVGSGAEYRWSVGSGASDYICSGVDKYEKEYRQISCDNGTTWSTIYPYETRLGDLLEEDSPDCPFTGKFSATYSGGTTYSIDCNSSQYLTTGNTKPSGYNYSLMISALIGDCSNLYYIDRDCFSNCSNLRKCRIGNNITRIGDYAFYGCSSLSGITIPNNVTGIGELAFYGCTSLSSVTIPDSVRTISASAFNNCSALTSATIGSGVISIDKNAFRYCSSLREIDIPSNVISIGNYAFIYCSGLQSITVRRTTPPTLGTSAFTDTNNCPIYVPCDYVDTYKSASGWTSYANRIQAIPNSCSPRKIESYYSDYTVYSAKCDSSTELTTASTKPSGYYYSYLTATTIGDCIETIGDRAFSGSPLYKMNSDTTGVVNIPSGITSIGMSAFYSARPSTVIIPDTVTTIGISAFKKCTYLNSITIGSGVTSIGAEAFSGCTSLTSITIPDGVTTISNRLLQLDNNLRTVTIGSGVTSIGDYAFYGCTSLTSITINTIEPPTLGSNALYNTNNCVIYVPASAVNDYRAASGWSDYASRIQAIPT